MFQVARKNMAGNAKSYLLYFTSMLISVVIYYTFVSLQYSDDIQKGMESSQNLQTVFLAASVVLVLFSAVFIWYSNSFFLKRRKREVGLYSLLGMRKKTIGRLLFYENMTIGAVVLAGGILLGMVLSKLFAMILVRLLGIETAIGFGLSGPAIINTLIVFAVILLATSVHGYRLIYQFQLIELFQAEKAGEPATRPRIWQALAAIALLAFGYALALQPIDTTEQFARNMGLALAGIIVGTYLLFRSTIAAALVLYRKNKKRYYRGMNLIGASNLSFRNRGNVRTFTLIALLSGLALGAFGLTYTQYYYTERSAETNTPFSYEFVSRGEPFDSQARQLIEADREHPVLAQLTVPVVEWKSERTNALELPIQYFSYAKPGTSISFLSASSYNRMSQALGREETVQLNGDEAASVRPMLDNQTADQYDGLSLKVQLEGGERTLPFVDFLKGRVLSWHFPDFYIVVSDSLFGEMTKALAPTTYELFRVENPESAKATSEKLLGMAADENRFHAFYTEYRNSLEESGLFLFIVGFLGLVFLAATGSVIYFKQLTEAQADRGRYETLRKIGVSRQEIRSSIAGQTLLAFALPLALGVAHGYVMIRIFTASLVGMNVTPPILISMGAYLVVYFVYYLISVRSNNRIVNPA
nr:ABC transporter permease [Cohnella zeiphila]